MRGTIGWSFISGSTLEWSKSASESRTVLVTDAEETEADEDEGIRAGAFLTALVENFFLAAGRVMEVVVGWFLSLLSFLLPLL